MLDNQNEKLIKEIKTISIKETKKILLKNGNELQIKRLNQITFRIRIEDNYQSFLAPVVLCILQNERKYKCFPFLYLKSILINGIGGTVLLISLSWLNIIQFDMVGI